VPESARVESVLYGSEIQGDREKKRENESEGKDTKGDFKFSRSSSENTQYGMQHE
jgi:hypothetical protein